MPTKRGSGQPYILDQTLWGVKCLRCLGNGHLAHFGRLSGETRSRGPRVTYFATPTAEFDCPTGTRDPATTPDDHAIDPLPQVQTGFQA